MITNWIGAVRHILVIVAIEFRDVDDILIVTLFKGENNVVADALSRLENSDNPDILNISELYGYNDKDLPDSAYPIRYHDIAKAQETYAKLQ